jgi:PPOX class probable F420-dependent enzyme
VVTVPSRRELIQMTDAERDAYLQGRHNMTMATLGPTGRIHLVAMWYAFHEGEVALATFGKSQKIANLRRDPRITLLVETGETYEELKGVEIEGRATVHDDRDLVLDVCTSLVQRYYPVDTEEQAREIATIMGAKRAVVTVTPEHISTWDHTKLQGRY